MHIIIIKISNIIFKNYILYVGIQILTKTWSIAKKEKKNLKWMIFRTFNCFPFASFKLE